MNVYYINLVKFFDLYNEGPKQPISIEYLRKLTKDPNNKIILAALHEVWPSEKILVALEMLELKPNQANVILLLDSYSYHTPNEWKSMNVLVYDSLLCLTHSSEEKHNNLNLDLDKFLFLVGTPYKKQRIYVMYELYKQNLLDSCEWSLHYSHHLEDYVRPILPTMSDDEYQKFISATTKPVDNHVPVFTQQSTNFQNIGFSPTSEIFSKASISLVTETVFSRQLYWFITEKTWKAVKNFHPFVLIGYKETYEYLESLDIDTFQYAMKHPYTDLVGTEEEVIKLCIDNVLHLLGNKHHYKDELENSVFTNNKVFERLADFYNARLHPYIIDLISKKEPYSKLENGVSLEVYEKLWGNNGAVGED